MVYLMNSNLFIFYNIIFLMIYDYIIYIKDKIKPMMRVSYNISKVIKLITDMKIIATNNYKFIVNARTTQNAELSIGKVDIIGSRFFINFSTI